MKNALSRCFLAMFVLLQVTFPIRAYAVAPIAVAAAVSVTAHGALLLLKLSSLSRGSSSSSSGGGGNDTGGMIVRLDGNTQTTPPGWATKAASDGKQVPVPPAKENKLPSKTVPGRHVNYRWSDTIKGFLPSPWTMEQYHELAKKLCEMGGESYGGGNQCIDWKGDYRGLNVIDGTGEVPGGCPSGYVENSDGSLPPCKLTNPEVVQKPSGTKCEAIFKNGQFQFDPNNPACDGKTKVAESNGCETEVSAGVYKLNCVDSKVNVSSSAITYQTPQGSGTVPVSVVDGAITITVPADKPMQFPGGFLPVTVDQTGTYSCDSYGLCVPAGVSSGGSSSGGGTSGGSTGGGDTGGGSSTGASTGGSSGGSGTGSGDGSGSGSGSGSASGSGAGSTTGNGNTSLDDSSFKGLGDKAGKLGLDGSGADDGAFNTLKEGISDKLGFLENFGFSWVPVPRDFAQCKPIPYAILGLSSSWDFCPYVDVLSQVMGYLFYVFTAVYLYRLFTSSSKD